MEQRMTTIRLRYVKEYRSGGQTFRYFRRKGCPPARLPGQPGSREFNSAYEAALNEKPLPKARHEAGTLGRLVTEYYGSVDFINLKPASRQSYRGILDPLVAEHGHRIVREMARENARKIIEKIGETHPGMANLTRAVLKRVMRYAIDRGWRNDNPTAGIAAYKIGRIHTWTDDELRTYEKRWPVGTQERLDYASLLYSGQRGGNVVQMLRPAPKATIIVVRLQKTRKGDVRELTIPIHPEWRRVIKRTPSTGLSLIGDARGRPIKRQMLTLRIRKAAKAAGLLPRCKAHGLRKALMRRLAEIGRSSKEIAGMSGHKTLREIERYTDAADQARLAEQAMSNLPAVRHSPRRK